jgi:hypothetical protein
MDNNITGTYIFYEDGKEIYRQSNLITKFGKRYITQALAGINGNDKKDIAVGVGSTSPTVNDTQLEFEFYRSQASMESIDIQTSSVDGTTSYGVIYKTTLPTDAAGQINEVGLFPSVTFGTTDYQSKIISTFEDTTQWTDSSSNTGVSVVDPIPPIGSSRMSVTSTAGVEKEYSYTSLLDLIGYGSNDSLTLAYRQSDNNLDYVFVRLYSSDVDYYEIRFDGTSIGNKLSNILLKDIYDNTYGYNSGTPTQDVIKISVGAKANSATTSSVLFDGLRINDEDTFRIDYGMISRSVLSTPQVKSLGKQMDIEYRLGLNF